MKEKFAIYNSSGKISKEFNNFEDFYNYVSLLSGNKTFISKKEVTNEAVSVPKKPAYILRKKAQRE